MNYPKFREKYIISANKLNPNSKEFKKIQEEVINLGNDYFIYQFAELVKGADILKYKNEKQMI